MIYTRKKRKVHKKKAQFEIFPKRIRSWKNLRKQKVEYTPKIDWEKAQKLFQNTTLPAASTSHYPSVRQILHVLAGIGAVGLVFAFPGAAPAIAPLVLGKRSYPPWRTRQVIEKMKRQKYVSVSYHDDGKVMVKITKDGMMKSLSYQLDDMKPVVPKRWDKKWRVVIFDIPEKYKKVRDIFRMRIKQMGLYQLQESVYVYPYQIFDEIEFLRELYGVAFKIRYLQVEKIEDSEYLKSRFDLE